MLKLCTLTILLLAAVPSHGTTPGTVVRVRQEALEYACQESKPFLLRGLLRIEIPSFVGSSGKLFGSILNIVGIKIANVEIAHLSVKLVPKTGVQVSLSSQFHVKGRVLFSPVELKVGASIALDVRVSDSRQGFPILSITACKTLLADVRIVVGGTNLLGFLTPLQDFFRAALVDKMCLSISNDILGLNAKLGTLVGLSSVSPMSHLQYSMVEPPEITSEYIDLDLQAAFTLTGKPIGSPISIPPFALPPSSDNSMLNMGISEQLLTNLFVTLGESGALNTVILSPCASPEGSYFPVTMLKTAIPSIMQSYPQDAHIALNVILSKVPLVSLQEGGAILRISPTVQLEVSSRGASSQVLCTLGLDVSVGLNLAVTVTSLHVTVSLHGEIGVALASSSVKVVDVGQLRTVVVRMFEKAFLAHLNVALSAGISLPKLDNFQYVDPQLQIHEGYAQVNCDLGYRP